MAVGLPLMLFLIYMASRQGLKGRDDLHGSARWAEYEDIDKMGYLKSEGVYVGGWWDEKRKIHYYLRHNGPEHILCFAPTRSGKGVGLILPTLLAWEHSSVVLDIKGENYALTTGYLKSLGHKTLRFDPSDAEGASAAFNPLEEIRLNSPLGIPDVQQISEILNKKSGLLGISGVSSDMRDVQSKITGGNKRAALAVEMFQYRVKKYIGSYIAALGGLDALIFTGGIGENNYKMRELICENMECFGIRIDKEVNAKTIGNECILSPGGAKVTVIVIPTDEEWMIASDTLRILS